MATMGTGRGVIVEAVAKRGSVNIYVCSRHSIVGFNTMSVTEVRLSDNIASNQRYLLYLVPCNFVVLKLSHAHYPSSIHYVHQHPSVQSLIRLYLFF